MQQHGTTEEDPLEQLRDAAAEVAERHGAWKEAVRQRDRLLRKLRKAGVAGVDCARAAGVSDAFVSKIAGTRRTRKPGGIRRLRPRRRDMTADLEGDSP
jgi:hypothetical protein